MYHIHCIIIYITYNTQIDEQMDTGKIYNIGVPITSQSLNASSPLFSPLVCLFSIPPAPSNFSASLC